MWHALSDGDRVYAVVKGIAVNNDGASNGLTAPNAKAQQEVILKAWERARIDPQDLSYIETHGTMAHADQTGQITVWASTQGSFNTRAEISDVLQIPEEKIKVIPMECGGGFGANAGSGCCGSGARR